MAAELLRDRAMSAAILGFFASTWFGWALEGPPVAWRRPLVGGAVAGVVVAAVGGVLAWRNWFGPSALDEPGAAARFGLVVGVEFAVAAAGAGILAAIGRVAFAAPWICLVVGVHFWFLAPTLNDPSLVPLGAALVAVALGGMAAAHRTRLMPSALVGVGAGSTLLVAAVGAALSALVGIAARS